MLHARKCCLPRGGRHPARAISSHAGSNSTRYPMRCHLNYLKRTFRDSKACLRNIFPKNQYRGLQYITPPPPPIRIWTGRTILLRFLALF